MTKNEWDEYASGWDEDEAARAYSRAAFTSLTEIATEVALDLLGARVLDFGCGTGLLTEQLVDAGAIVHAVDTSPAMLDVLNEKTTTRAWSKVETSQELPDAVPAFDLVVCSSVCSFLDDYPGSVIDLVSRLRPGGLFVQWDWERVEGDPHGLGRDEIANALTQAGLGSPTVKVAFTAAVGEQEMSPLLGYGQQSADQL